MSHPMRLTQWCPDQAADVEGLVVHTPQLLPDVTEGGDLYSKQAQAAAKSKQARSAGVHQQFPLDRGPTCRPGATINC